MTRRYRVGDIVLYQPNEEQKKQVSYIREVDADAPLRGHQVKIVEIHSSYYIGRFLTGPKQGVDTFYFVESCLQSIGGNVMKELFNEAKSFLKDNRQIVGYLVLVLLLDHFVFGGAMRERLKDLVNKMLGKVEKSLE